MKKQILFYLTFFLLFAQNLSAASQFVTLNHADLLTGSAGNTGSILIPQNPCLDQVYRSAHLQARFDLGDVYDLGANTWDAVVTCEVWGKDISNTQLFYYVIQLRGDEVKPEEVFDKDILSHFPGLHHIDYDVSGYANNHVASQAAARFQIGYVAEIGTDITGGTAGSAAVTLNNPVQINPGQMQFSWVPNCALIPNYEFQLLRLYNTDATSTSELSIDAKVNWKEALTYVTDGNQTSVTVSINEGTGYYVWRVMPVGDFHEGGIADARNWGNYSTSLLDGSQSVTADILPHLFFHTQFEDNYNWSHSRIYTEGGRIKEQKTYANGLQYSKQSQVLLPSEQTAILSQTEYDFSGRPALSSLPAPTGDNYLHFVPGALKHNGVVYGPEDFDQSTAWNNTWHNPNTIDGGLIADYYAGNDPAHMVPDAGGYAFSRVIYSGDGTSRVLEESGPGETHCLGAPGQARTTKHFNSSVTDLELIRLFGDEAPSRRGVLKTIVVDPNGTASVSYLDKSGKTIATCLSGGEFAPNPLLGSLPSRIGNNFMVEQEIEQIVKQPNGHMISYASLAFTEPTTITIELAMTANEIQTACPSLCQTCDYRIYVKLSRIDDPSVPCTNCGIVPNSDRIVNAAACNSGAGYNNPTLNESLTLDPGEYIIERVVEPYQEDPNNAPASYLQSFREDVLAALDQDASTALNQLYTEMAAGDLDAVNTYLETIDNNGPSNGYWTIPVGCNTITLPYENCEDINCENVDWAGMLVDRWSQPGGSPIPFWTFIPGTSPYKNGTYDFVNPLKFNAVVDRMLDNEEVPPGTYTCEQIYGCWMAIVEATGMLQAQYPQNGLPEFDPIGAFFDCAGYHIQGETLDTGLPNSVGWASHPYAWMEETTINSNCATAVCGSSSCLTASSTTEEWTNYFHCVRGSTAAVVGPIPSGLPPYSTTPAQMVLEMEGRCTQVCEDRFDAFVLMVRDHYHGLGFQVEDESPTGTVSLDVVYCQANEMVEKCKSNCDYIAVPPSSPTEIQPAPGANPECWMTGVMTIFVADINNGNDCSIGTSLANNLPADVGIVNFLNQRLSEERIQAQYPSSTWDFSTDINMFNNSPSSLCSSTSVVIHPDETSYFQNTYPSGGGCLTEYVREAAFHPAPTSTYVDADGDFHEIELEVIIDNNQQSTTQTFSFEGEWSFGGTTGQVISPSSGVTVNVINTTSFSVTGPINVPITIVFTGAVQTTQMCSDLCTLILGCSKYCVTCDPIPINPPDYVMEPITCDQYGLNNMSIAIQQELARLRDEGVSNMEEIYETECIDGYADIFKVSYPLNYHHYTLYSYDRAGNLVRTTPPHGIDLSKTDRTSHPGHNFETKYEYNSLGQLIWQSTPDGGETNFWYDDLGRLRFSQNAEQKDIIISNNTYSYTKYDYLGRTIEVGESNEDFINLALDVNVNDAQTFPSTGWSRVYTVYSKNAAITNHQGQEQRFLDNNVSYAYNDEGIYTFFSYDPHGNVDWMIQRLPGLDGDKQIAYEYDLVSGKVLKVKYQEGFPDQFYHRYSYDEDNRLTIAETSLDGLIWDRDGRYDYYKHGPLERLEIGEDKVQGLDQVYTIQGWLKGINHGSLEKTLDPGTDGLNNNVGQDAWGMMLGYFDGDFTQNQRTDFNSTSGNAWNLSPTTAYGAGYTGLYNGNISTWSWRTGDFKGNQHNNFTYGETRAYAFKYDELNRIDNAEHFNYYNGAFQPSTNDYHADYKYDAAGNISTLTRNNHGASQNMDQLQYHYATLSGGDYVFNPGNTYTVNNVPNQPLPADATNRLLYVDDNVAGISVANDLPPQSLGNYSYNEIGELTDDVSENLHIVWTPYHKVAKVDKMPQNTGDIKELAFSYDAMQHRTSKHVTYKDIDDYEKTYYIYDAQGNVMSIYSKERDGDWVTTKQTEIPIYGSDRLGLVRRDLVLKKGAICEGCGDPKEDPIDPSELRIVELNHDSPLTQPNKKTEINLGEYIVLKNTSGRNLPMGDVQVGQGGNWWQFSATDTLVPNAYALVCYGTVVDQAQFLSANNLPIALTTDPTVQWHWQSTIDFPDAEGQATVRLYENGKPGATLDQVYWNPDGLQAINAYCDSTCQINPNREAVVSLQLDDYTYDPINPWDASKWTTAEATAKGKGTSQPEAPTAVRGLLKKEYELKDHLGNVHVVVTDRKHSDVASGTPINFMGDVVVMRDYYPFGMEMEGQGYAAGEYRYGFNGMERDNELKGSGDSYDFGARIYDPRVGRWWSCDPLESKYPEISTFVFVLNNPQKYSDKDGREPTKDKIVGLSGLMVKLRFVDDLTELLHEYGGGQNGILDFGTSYPNMLNERFLYSEKWGWIDMRHFSAGAYYTDTWYLTAEQVLNKGKSTEKTQEKNGSSSAWSYEDLTSNLLGAYFETYLESEEATGKSFNENLFNYFSELGFVDNPLEVAPNACEIPNIEDQNRMPIAKSKDYTPLFTQKPRDGELDLKIIKFAKDNE